MPRHKSRQGPHTGGEVMRGKVQPRRVTLLAHPGVPRSCLPLTPQVPTVSLEPREPARETNPPVESAGITKPQQPSLQSPLRLPAHPQGDPHPAGTREAEDKVKQEKAKQKKEEGTEGDPRCRLDQCIEQGWKVRPWDSDRCCRISAVGGHQGGTRLRPGLCAQPSPCPHLCSGGPLSLCPGVAFLFAHDVSLFQVLHPSTRPPPSPIAYPVGRSTVLGMNL